MPLEMLLQQETKGLSSDSQENTADRVGWLLKAEGRADV